MGRTSWLAKGLTFSSLQLKKLSCDEGRSCGAVVFLHGPNSYGGALLSEESPTFDEIVNQALEGRLKILICLENDFLNNYPDLGLARQLALNSPSCLLSIICRAPVRSVQIFSFPLRRQLSKRGYTSITKEGCRPSKRFLIPAFLCAKPGTVVFRHGFLAPPRAPDQPWEARRILASMLGLEDSCAEVRGELERGGRLLSGFVPAGAGK